MSKLLAFYKIHPLRFVGAVLGVGVVVIEVGTTVVCELQDRKSRRKHRAARQFVWKTCSGCGMYVTSCICK